MTRPRSASLTDAETRLMRVLWDRRRATVGEVVSALRGRRRPAYNTVLTLLRILERKGYVRHEKVGRAFLYEPVLDRARAQQGAVQHLLDRLFDNSPRDLVLNLLRDDRLDAEELRSLRELIESDGKETA
jgi:predicted transcriptional regulator